MNLYFASLDYNDIHDLRIYSKIITAKNLTILL